MGTKWQHYLAGQDARASIMAGNYQFVALPFDVADGTLVVGEPVEGLTAAMQGDANLTAHDARGGDMNETASEFERLLGHAALKLWPDLPPDVQELLFEAAVPLDPVIPRLRSLSGLWCQCR